MGPLEIISRLQNEIHVSAESFGFFTASVPPFADLRVDVSSWLPMEGLDSARDIIIESADDLLSEGIKILSLDKRISCVNPQWNKDPRTGIVCPLTFGKKLDFKDQSLCGDVKYVWELSRFLQIVPLARAWSISGDDKYSTAIRSMLESWHDQCPYMKGVHWSSSLEVSIRLINWAIAWQYLGGVNSKLFSGKGGEEFRTRWLQSIYQHIHFVTGWYSKGSSANNHLIGEATGVYTACKTWPFWTACKKWEESSLTVLETESRKQVFDDGVCREQSTSYQQFIIDFFLFPYLIDKNRCSSYYINNLERMIEFLGSLMDGCGNVPMIGDADDGVVTGLGLFESFNSYKSILATGGVIFDRHDFFIKSGGHDLKSVCLTGCNLNSATGLDSTGISVFNRNFQSGGYFILGNDLGDDSELFLVVDAGPLGYGTLAAHGHADALSIYLSFKGREFLIDPGTYVYNGNPKWRDYFRGTSAHNTVRIDGLDQSEMAGDFLWKTHAKAHGVVHFDLDVETFRGEHNGYERLSDPVVHERAISLDKQSGRIVVQDHLRCNSTHSAQQFWHFSEECEVVFDGPHKVKATNNGVNLELHFGAAVSLQIIKGDTDKPLGWVSRRYGVKVPSVTVVAEARIEKYVCLVTEIICDDHNL